MKFKEEHGSAGTQIASILVAMIAAILTIHATAVFLERQMINDAIEMSYISIDYASKVSSALDSVPADNTYDVIPCANLAPTQSSRVQLDR